MKKRIYFFVFTLLLIGATATINAQGLENFTNSNATGSYADGSFVGENGITWTYVASRDDAGTAAVTNPPALMLRRVSDVSSVTSSTISGGIGDFSVKLYKGFTGGGDRQVELFINNVSYGTSTAFDDFSEHIFSVTGINVSGDVVIRLDNITAKQVIVDDIGWTGFASNPIIAAQSFEEDFSAGWAFTNDPVAYHVGSDVWDSVQTWNSIVPSDGSLMWGMQDLENSNGGGDFWHTLTFVPVDVSGNANVSLSFDYYSFEFDGSDSIGYIVEFDNGATWGPVVELNKDTQAWTTVTVNVPGGTQWVRLRLQARQNGGGDYATFDNIVLENNEGGDDTPPEVTEGGFTTPTDFYVTFTEPVTQASAENTSNYSVTPGMTVTGVTLTASMDTVYGTVTPGLAAGVEYTVDITGVVDTSANANVMVPFSTSFYFNDYSGTDLIITELYYSNAGIQDMDYFEVYNKGATPIEMAGMYFTQGVNLDINTSLVVPAGEYFVFCEVLDSFNLAFPSVTNVMAWESGGLSGGGEDIEIVNSLGEQVTFVDYKTSAPWPSWSDTTASELCDLGTDYTDGSNWRHASQVSSTVSVTLYGSPGTANLCEDPPPVTDVATMAELRAGLTDGTLYRLTGEVVLTFQQSFRNQKYIQDATAGILIDDDGGAISTSYDVNDGITNLTGTLSEFGGMMQFLPSGDPGAATSTGNTVTPQEITLGDLKSNFEDYEAELVKIMSVNFSDAGGNFSNGTVYETFVGTDTTNFRTTFYSVDYIGTAIPDSANVVALPNSRNDGEYYTSRDAADIEVLLPPTSAITFRVDMSQSGEDLGSGVYLMGTVTDWDPGVAMDDADNDSIYELTLDLAGGDYQYKFKTGAGAWEDLDGDIFPGSNRAVTVVLGEDQTLEFCWESTQACSDVATSITFKVDMNYSGQDLSSGVDLMGTATDWGTGAAMDDSDGDLVYELTLELQPNTYLFKFKTGTGAWEGTANRMVTVIDGETQMLPAVCWESLDLCPYPGITITAPEEGSTSTSADVTVDLAVVNFVVGNPGDAGVEGHIHWTLDGVDQAMKYDTNPIDLVGLEDGDHTVMLKLVDNAHADLEPLRADTVTFNVNTTIVGGGMETFTLSNATNSYETNSYVGDNGITWNYVESRDGNGDANGSGIDLPALMLRRVADLSAVYSESIPDGVGSFSVKLYKGFTGGGDRQVEVFINDVSYGMSAPFDDFDMHLFTVDNINVPGDVVIRIDNITPKQVIVDDISWTGYAGAAVPGLSITSPIEGSTSEFTDLPVVFSVMNFVVGNPGDTDVEGHIHWSLDGVDQPMKYDTDPIELTGLAESAHTVIMKLVDNDHNDLDPTVADTVNFTVDTPDIVDVATMADLRAGSMDGTVYRLTGEAVITYEQSFRHQKYLQDATGAILIDDDPGVITTDYVREDGMTNLTGTLNEFGGMLQFNPFVDPGAPSSSGNVVVPEVVTLDELNSNFADYESELILVEEVTFAIGGTDIFENGNNYDISDPSGDGIFRTNFFFVDYIETLIPQLANVTSLAIENNGTAQIVARDMADFDIIDAVNELDKANFSIYPNPNNGQFTLINDGNTGEYLIELIDLTGKVIHSELISLNNSERHIISSGDVVSGVYLVKLINTQDNYSRTMRMIVK